VCSIGEQSSVKTKEQECLVDLSGLVVLTGKLRAREAYIALGEPTLPGLAALLSIRVSELSTQS
jgi:hypothetical protein